MTTKYTMTNFLKYLIIIHVSQCADKPTVYRSPFGKMFLSPLDKSKTEQIDGQVCSQNLPIQGPSNKIICTSLVLSYHLLFLSKHPFICSSIYSSCIPY